MKPAQASILLSLLALPVVASLASVERPNVVLILADDQGWNALSAPMDPEVAGSKSDYHNTPHTDRLMGDGMRFTDGYAPAPVCSPTRHSIQFGISPAKTRVTHNSPKYIQRCDPQLALASLVKKADGRYATAHFGKWHVSLPPNECGYDESDGSTANVEGSNSDDVDDPKRTFEVTERAVDFMERKARSDQPFFLQVSYYADHLAFKARASSIDKYKGIRKGERHNDPVFAGMNEELDTGVGMLLETIKELGLDHTTYVIYTADNGFDESLRQLHGDGKRKAWPLSFSKGFVREGGIRVPFIVRGPGIKAGSISRTPVIGYDLLPTILDWIEPGIEMPDVVEGGSLRALLENEGKGNVERSNDFLVFHYPTGVWPAMSALRQGDIKIVKTWAYNRVQTYDLSADLSETRSRSKGMPEKTEQLHQLLMDYLKRVDAIEPPETELAIDRTGILMKKSAP